MMTERYSSSYLASFKSCPLACCYRYEVGLTPMVEGIESHHLAYGKAGHQAFEQLYKRQYWTGSSDYQQTVLARAQAAFLETYPVQLDDNDQAKTRDNGVKMLAAYVDRWRDVDACWDVLECEEPSFNDDWALRLDLVVRDKQTGAIYGVDHKITGGQQTKYLGQRYWETFEPNSQITYYVKHVQEKYGACDGFIINAVGMGYRGRRVKVKGTDDYLPAGPWCRFERQTFNRTTEQLQDEEASTRAWVVRIQTAKNCLDAGLSSVAAYGFNTNNCMNCMYRPLCRAGWTWPRDEAAILCSYRQVCGKVIPNCCEYCSGTGSPMLVREDNYRSYLTVDNEELIRATESLATKGEFTIVVMPCEWCNGTGANVDVGMRCQLDRGHDNACRHRVEPARAPGDIEIDVEVG